MGRILAAARIKYLEEGSPYLGTYSGDNIVPEEDPERLLSYYAFFLLPPSNAHEKLANIEINKIYPDFRKPYNKKQPWD